MNPCLGATKETTGSEKEEILRLRSAPWTPEKAPRRRDVVGILCAGPRTIGPRLEDGWSTSPPYVNTFLRGPRVPGSVHRGPLPFRHSNKPRKLLPQGSRTRWPSPGGRSKPRRVQESLYRRTIWRGAVEGRVGEQTRIREGWVGGYTSDERRGRSYAGILVHELRDPSRGSRTAPRPWRTEAWNRAVHIMRGSTAAPRSRVPALRSDGHQPLRASPEKWDCPPTSAHRSRVAWEHGGRETDQDPALDASRGSVLLFLPGARDCRDGNLFTRGAADLRPFPAK